MQGIRTENGMFVGSTLILSDMSDTCLDIAVSKPGKYMGSIFNQLKTLILNASLKAWTLTNNKFYSFYRWLKFKLKFFYSINFLNELYFR